MRAMMPQSPFSVGQMRNSDSGHLYFYTGHNAAATPALAGGRQAADGGISSGARGHDSGSTVFHVSPSIGLQGLQRQLSPPAAPTSASEGGKKPNASGSGLFNYWKRGVGAGQQVSKPSSAGLPPLSSSENGAALEKELITSSPTKPARATTPGGAPSPSSPSLKQTTLPFRSSPAGKRKADTLN